MSQLGQERPALQSSGRGPWGSQCGLDLLLVTPKTQMILCDYLQNSSCSCSLRDTWGSRSSGVFSTVLFELVYVK